VGKRKIVIDPRPYRVESGPDVGIALQIMYNMVEPGDAGYDLFDDYQPERLRRDFIPLNETRFNFTFEPGPMNPWKRVFAEFKGSGTPGRT